MDKKFICNLISDQIFYQIPVLVREESSVLICLKVQCMLCIQKCFSVSSIITYSAKKDLFSGADSFMASFPVLCMCFSSALRANGK